MNVLPFLSQNSPQQQKLKSDTMYLATTEPEGTPRTVWVLYTTRNVAQSSFPQELLQAQFAVGN